MNNEQKARFAGQGSPPLQLHRALNLVEVIPQQFVPAGFKQTENQTERERGRETEREGETHTHTQAHVLTERERE